MGRLPRKRLGCCWVVLGSSHSYGPSVFSNCSAKANSVNHCVAGRRVKVDTENSSSTFGSVLRLGKRIVIEY